MKLLPRVQPLLLMAECSIRDEIYCSYHHGSVVSPWESARTIFQDPMTSLNRFYHVSRQLTEVLEVHQRLSSGVALKRLIEMLERVGYFRCSSSGSLLPT